MKDLLCQIKRSRAEKHDQDDDAGFTLVEILIAIVLVGILSAVVIVGISNLTSKGTNSACAASADAAKAGAIVYYAANGNTYPTTLTQMTTATGSGTAAIPAALTLPSGVTIDAATSKVASGGGWTLTMTSVNSTTPPTFACS